jgi:DNA-binding FadR family transcriptional regulator
MLPDIHYDFAFPSSRDPLSTDTAFELKEMLLADLRNGRWRPGERLPAERQMMEVFKVGRSTVRRALTQMKGMGLITQAVGSGTYVAPDALLRLPQPALPPRPVPGTSTSPAELMEARLAFEPALVELVIRNANAADFAAMDHCLRYAENALGFEQFEHWDGALHRSLAEATHNSVVLTVFKLMSEERERAEWGQLKRQSLTPDRRLAYQHEHRALVDALRQRDAPLARKAIHAHLTHVQRNLFDPGSME